MGPRTSLGAFGKGTVLGLFEIAPRFPQSSTQNPDFAITGHKILCFEVEIIYSINGKF